MNHTDHLYYFKPEEFTRGGEAWFPDMSPRLLVLLDLLRFRWGKPIRVSKDSGAVGRFLGDNMSQHNITKWGEVRAVDILPDGVTNHDSAYAFFMLAIECGFTGIGLYLDWASGVGFHLDVRTDKQPGYPSTWGRVQGAAGSRYVSLNDALEDMA